MFAPSTELFSCPKKHISIFKGFFLNLMDKLNRTQQSWVDEFIALGAPAFFKEYISLFYTRLCRDKHDAHKLLDAVAMSRDKSGNHHLKDKDFLSAEQASAWEMAFDVFAPQEFARVCGTSYIILI
jgi:hypothetical protein